LFYLSLCLLGVKPGKKKKKKKFLREDPRRAGGQRHSLSEIDVERISTKREKEKGDGRGGRGKDGRLHLPCPLANHIQAGKHAEQRSEKERKGHPAKKKGGEGGAGRGARGGCFAMLIPA